MQHGTSGRLRVSEIPAHSWVSVVATARAGAPLPLWAAACHPRRSRPPRGAGNCSPSRPCPRTMGKMVLCGSSGACWAPGPGGRGQWLPLWLCSWVTDGRPCLPHGVVRETSRNRPPASRGPLSARAQEKQLCSRGGARQAAVVSQASPEGWSDTVSPSRGRADAPLTCLSAVVANGEIKLLPAFGRAGRDLLEQTPPPPGGDGLREGRSGLHSVWGSQGVRDTHVRLSEGGAHTTAGLLQTC